MKLVDLHPRWIEKDGRRVAAVFKCPHCVAGGREKPLLLSFALVPWRQPFPKVDAEFNFFDALLPELGFEGYGRDNLAGCNPSATWTASSDDFTTITVSPSIDASPSGHWNGHIKNGEIC